MAMECAFGSIFEWVGTGFPGLFCLLREKGLMFVFGLIGGAELGF